MALKDPALSAPGTPGTALTASSTSGSSTIGKGTKITALEVRHTEIWRTYPKPHCAHVKVKYNNKSKVHDHFLNSLQGKIFDSVTTDVSPSIVNKTKSLHNNWIPEIQ